MHFKEVRDLRVVVLFKPLPEGQVAPSVPPPVRPLADW
jgi:hypothetical protein